MPVIQIGSIPIFICSPFRGETQADQDLNLDVARLICLKACQEGYAPFAPHLLYPQFLTDAIPAEREMGMRAGLAFARLCRGAWIDRRMGITMDMALEIEALDKLIPKANRITWKEFVLPNSLPEIPLPHPRKIYL